jgi:hypothetical protein
VVVLINGRPLSTRWTSEHVPALVEAWETGERGGEAVADVLFDTRRRKIKQAVISHIRLRRSGSQKRLTSSTSRVPLTFFRALETKTLGVRHAYTWLMS